ETGVVDGELRRGHGIARKEIHAPHLHGRDEVARLEVAHHRRSVRVEAGGVEAVDLGHCGFSFVEQRAEALHANGARRHDAEACDGYTHRLNSKDTFEPPKPKVFEIAALMSMGRGVCGM